MPDVEQASPRRKKRWRCAAFVTADRITTKTSNHELISFKWQSFYFVVFILALFRFWSVYDIFGTLNKTGGVNV